MRVCAVALNTYCIAARAMCRHIESCICTHMHREHNLLALGKQAVPPPWPSLPAPLLPRLTWSHATGKLILLPTPTIPGSLGLHRQFRVPHVFIVVCQFVVNSSRNFLAASLIPHYKQVLWQFTDSHTEVFRVIYQLQVVDSIKFTWRNTK